MNKDEIEVKFYILHLKDLEARLRNLGAQVSQPRMLEINLRFDTPDGSLTRAGQVLRLRREADFRFTYKEPMRIIDSVSVRKEIEFTVGDFNAAKAFLEALGYQVSVMYEKYRACYVLQDVEVSLDELPYGTFIEIEGPDPASVNAVQSLLGLNSQARVLESYLVLFERLKLRRNLTFRDLNFENFKGISISHSDFPVIPAD